MFADMLERVQHTQEWLSRLAAVGPTVSTCLLVTVACFGLGKLAFADETTTRTVQCGALYARVTPLKDQSFNTHGLQVFVRFGQEERAALPIVHETASPPGVACVGKSVLVSAFSTQSGHDLEILVFPDGFSVGVSADDWEFREGVALISRSPAITLRGPRKDSAGISGAIRLRPERSLIR